jgi:hypothetical protein
MPVGQTVLLDPARRPKGSCIEVLEGMARVYCPCEETEGMTLAFLQPGDQLRWEERIGQTWTWWPVAQRTGDNRLAPGGFMVLHPASRCLSILRS